MRNFLRSFWGMLGTGRNRRRGHRESQDHWSAPATLEVRTLLTVTFHGGALMSNVQTQAVYLGSDWQATTSLQTQSGQIDQYLSTLVTGAYMDMLTNAGYNVGRGSSSAGVINNMTLNKTTGITDQSIQQNIQSMITAGQLQPPNPNRLYVIYVEPGVVVKNGTSTSAVNFLGYHGAFAGRTATGTAADIRYAVMPYPGGVNPTPASQGFTSTFNELTVVTSHEVAEAVTDPDVNYKQLGWYDDTLDGEIGDLTDLTATLSGYLVQQVVNKNDQPIAPPVTTNPTVSIRAVDASAAETASGVTANGGSFQVTRTGTTTAPLNILLTISGTATNGTDYNTISATVTIPAGATSATVNLTVKDDALSEGTETAVFALANSSGYVIDPANPAATINIADNEPAPILPVVTLSVIDGAAAETNTGVTANGGTVQIRRTGATTSPLSVSLGFTGTAINGTDYTLIANTVTIPAGASSVNIPLTVKNDTLVEPVETAIFTVVAGAGYAIGTMNSGTVSITDNDVSNDLFANRYVIAGNKVTVTGSNVGATAEAGEPNNAGVSGAASVWWTWTAPSSGVVTLSTAGSSFDTTLGVYRGNAVNSLTTVASNDDENTAARIYTSNLTFNAIAGQVYQIEVNGYRSGSTVATGRITLALSEVVNNASLVSKPTEWMFMSVSVV